MAQGRARRPAAERPRDGRAQEGQARLTDETLARHAYQLCAAGDFDRALSIALPLARHARDPNVKARAAVTAGSALRQLHRYPEAASVERAALRTAPIDQRAHLLIGLAADAVGIGDARRSARLLAKARAVLPNRDARARIRLAWVHAEHAMLTRRPRDAAAFARDALRRSRRAALPRHEAKSLLFLGAALLEHSTPASRAALTNSLRKAELCNARPVAAVAGDLLARLDG